MEEPQLVFVIKLNTPIMYYWNNNPRITELIIPMKGGLASKLLDKINGFVFLPFPVFGEIYWWQCEYIEVWEKGKMINKITEFYSPYSTTDL